MSGTILLDAKTQQGQFSPSPYPDGDQIPVARETAQSNETKIDLNENEARPKVSRSQGGSRWSGEATLSGASELRSERKEEKVL